MIRGPSRAHVLGCSSSEELEFSMSAGRLEKMGPLCQRGVRRGTPTGWAWGGWKRAPAPLEAVAPATQPPTRNAIVETRMVRRNGSEDSFCGYSGHSTTRLTSWRRLTLRL